MDRTTVFTKTAKGLMEATGKTSHLSRDIRAVLKEVDGRATVELLQTRLGKLSEAKLQEALEALMKDDFVREFSTAASSVAPTTARTAPPPPKAPAASGDEDLDFTSAIPSAPSVDKRAEEAARQKAQAAAAARAKAAAEAAARARAEAEAKAKAQAAARAKAEAEAKAKAEAAARAKAEAEARAKREAEERARKEAEDRARREAEEKARREAEELRATLEQERKAREEAERKAKEQAERERREAEEKARREADELRAKLEEERRAREEAERKVREQAERERREAEEKARREADELRAKLEAERKAREEAERRAKEEAERERREAEEKARREADELRARLEEERRAREEAERKAKEEAERRAKEEAERVRLEAEEKSRREAEEQARRQAEERAKADEQARIDAEKRARQETDDAQRAREEAERKAREQAELGRREAEDRTRRETEEKARREAEEQARQQAEVRRQAEERARIEAEEAERRAREEAKRKAQEEAERERRETEEKAAQQPPAAEPAGSALDDLVKIETDFDAELKASVAPPQEAAKRPAGPDDLLQKAAEELERRQAEEQARAAEEKARARAKAEAEAEAKRAEEEGRSKGEGQERPKAAPAGVEEHLSSQAEAQALLDEQNAETERHFADMEKELEAEQAAAPVPKKAPEPQEAAPARKKKEAKQSARAAAAAAAAAQAREAELEIEPVPAPYRPRINWGKPVALGLFLLIVLGLVVVNFISFDGSIPQFEKAAGAYLQQPVKIKALHLSLVPRPHWRLDGVSVGNEGQLKAAGVNAVAELGSMFSDKKAFSSIELESPVLSEQGFLGLLFGKPAGRDFKVASIVAKNAKLESKTFILPVLDAKIALGEDGVWQKIALETPDHKTSLSLTPEGEGAALEVETNAFSLPFHPSFILENFVASGQIRRGELRLKEFKGGIFDGYLSGNAVLKWSADWSLDGDISVRAMDPGKFVPALLDQGRLEGKAAYSMRAKSYDELFESPRLEGNFDILKGNLLGVDLGRMLQGGGVGGKTAYAELTGSFVREAGRIQLRQVNLASGPVSAGGSAEVDAAKRISGRFAVELKSPVAHARANVTLSGTLQEPHFSR